MTNIFNIDPKGPEIIPGKIDDNFKMENVMSGIKLNTYGIKETLEAVDAVCSLANALDASLSDDGKFTAGDLPKFLSPAMKLPKAVAGISRIPAELNDLNDDEKQDIKSKVEESLQLEANTELIIELSMQILFDIQSLAVLIKDSKKS